MIEKASGSRELEFEYEIVFPSPCGEMIEKGDV